MVLKIFECEKNDILSTFAPMNNIYERNLSVFFNLTDFYRFGHMC